MNWLHSNDRVRYTGESTVGVVLPLDKEHKDDVIETGFVRVRFGDKIHWCDPAKLEKVES